MKVIFLIVAWCSVSLAEGLNPSPGSSIDYFLSTKDKLAFLDRRISKFNADVESIANTKRGKRLTSNAIYFQDRRKGLDDLLNNMGRLDSQEKSVTELKINVGMRDLAMDLANSEKDLKR